MVAGVTETGARAALFGDEGIGGSYAGCDSVLGSEVAQDKTSLVLPGGSEAEDALCPMPVQSVGEADGRGQSRGSCRRGAVPVTQLGKALSCTVQGEVDTPIAPLANTSVG